MVLTSWTKIFLTQTTRYQTNIIRVIGFPVRIKIQRVFFFPEYKSCRDIILGMRGRQHGLLSLENRVGEGLWVVLLGWMLPDHFLSGSLFSDRLSLKSFRAACLSPVEAFCFLSFSFSWFTAANLSNQGHLPGAFPTVNIWHCLGRRGACLLSPEYRKGGHLSLCSAIALVINPLFCLSNQLLIHPVDFILQCTWSDDCVLNMGNAILSPSQENTLMESLWPLPFPMPGAECDM